MKFNDTSSEKNGLIQDITYWTGADTSSSAFPIADRTRGINEWYRLVVGNIERYSSQTWRFDDRNLGNLPFADADLEDGQEQYQLPHEAKKIYQVNVLDSSGDWNKLEHIDLMDIDIAYSEFEEDNGLPYYYDLYGDSVYLKPAPAEDDVTLASGLRIYTSRGIEEFSISDTSAEPGFHHNFHRLLSIGPSYDYLSINGGSSTTLSKLEGLIVKYEDLLADAYSTKSVEGATKMKPHRENMI